MLPTGTFNENLPSMSVIVPVVVPFTDTLAPIIVSPVASLTTPEIVRELCWATASPHLKPIRSLLLQSRRIAIPGVQGLRPNSRF